MELLKCFILVITYAVARVVHIEVTPDVVNQKLVTTSRVLNPLKLKTFYGKKILNGNLFQKNPRGGVVFTNG